MLPAEHLLGLIENRFVLSALFVVAAACSASAGTGGDAARVPEGDAAAMPDTTLLWGDVMDVEVPPRDSGVDAVCSGCFLGAACVPASPTQCGFNSACVRCAPPPVAECQEATCDDGVCSVRNVPDGTGCTGGVCLRGGCNRCGTNDTACCPAPNRCNPGLTCVANDISFQYCVPCGALGAACCGGVGTVRTVGGVPVARNPGGTCDVSLSCNAEGACSCGALGEACCTGSMCREGRCRRDGTCGT